MDSNPDPQEVARRLRAARELAGLSQTELGERLTDYGLGKHDAGRLERGDLTLQKKHRDGLAEALGVPGAWFTVSRDRLFQGIGDALASDDYRSRLTVLEEEVKRLVAGRSYPAPPGELGRRAEDSRPSDAHRPQDENQAAEDQKREAEE